MWTTQEVRPWLVDFHAVAALDSFLVSWGFAADCFWLFLRFGTWAFLLGLFLVISASCDLCRSPWVGSGSFGILNAGFAALLV